MSAVQNNSTVVKKATPRKKNPKKLLIFSRSESMDLKRCSVALNLESLVHHHRSICRCHSVHAGGGARGGEGVVRRARPRPSKNKQKNIPTIFEAYRVVGLDDARGACPDAGNDEDVEAVCASLLDQLAQSCYLVLAGDVLALGVRLRIDAAWWFAIVSKAIGMIGIGEMVKKPTLLFRPEQFLPGGVRHGGARRLLEVFVEACRHEALQAPRCQIPRLPVLGFATLGLVRQFFVSKH